MSVVRIEGLQYQVQPHFWSSKRTILDGVALDIEAGEIFGFLGPNGAGKTTTIKCLLGLAQPSAGTILLLGRPPSDAAARRGTGYMPEIPYFPEQLSARELMLQHGMLAGLGWRRAHTRAEEVLERVDLCDAADNKLRGYSKGMLQRAGLAQALIGDPELVVLDEPMSGLDPIGRRDIREIMVELSRQGKTVFFSTHILPDVEMICDRIGIIDRGRTRAVGRLTELVGEAAERVEISVASCDAETRATVEPLVQRTVEHIDHVVFEATDVESANRIVDALRARRVAVGGFQVIRRSLEDLFLTELAPGGDAP